MTAIGTLVFACTFGGALARIWLHTALPEHHLSDESKDTVKVGIGLIATMTALVLGLVTSLAKSSFDALDTAVKHTAEDVLTLDRTLARYRPESREVREALYHAVERRLEMTWPQKSSRAAELEVPDMTRVSERVVDRIRGPIDRCLKSVPANSSLPDKVLHLTRLGGEGPSLGRCSAAAGPRT